MGSIVLLDDLTINKIAAGEVIERPASAIKEMLENSIDAGATNIIIEIKNGGISYIRITDNGKGIANDDLDMAFERHATSKIRSAEDLNTIKSMGFRGEALASIVAISKVEMISRTSSQQNGYRVIVEGGNILEKSETGAPIGTTIIVTDLFYNTPVRYKFLRKDFTEAGYIEDAVSRIALSHPEIAIKLINSGRTVIQTNGSGDLKTTIYSIYGKEIANSVIYVDYKADDIHIYGVIGKPEIARSNRANQIFFINKRYVKDKTLASAVERAYKDIIPMGKFAFVILNIDMDSRRVDVNVHPAKLEVRFEDENVIFKAIYHAIKENLMKKENNETENFEEKTIETPKIQESNNEKKLIEDETILKSQEILRKLQDMKEKMLQENKKITEELDKEIQTENEEIIEEPITEEKIHQEEPTKHEEKEPNGIKYNITENDSTNTKTEEPSTQYNVTENKPEFDEMYLKTFGTKPIKKEEIEEIEEKNEEQEKEETLDDIATTENVSIFEETPEQNKINYKFIGMAFEKYVILEIENEVYLLDQKVAEERILYESIINSINSGENGNSQLLLIPDVITLSHKDMEIVKDNAEMLKKAGFIFDNFGENTVKLTEVPEICADLETKELFLEILEKINSVARTQKSEVKEKFAQIIAENVAKKLEIDTKQDEIENLIDKLLILPNPFIAADGTPIAIKMSKYDIERKFARK